MLVKPLRGRERAQSLTEFALILPVFVILVFGIIDFGMGLRAYITVSQATREGARYGVVGNAAGTFSAGGSGDCNGSTTTNVVGKVCSTMNGLDLTDIQTVTVECPDSGTSPPCDSGDAVEVHAEFRYHYITPVKTIANFFSAGSLPNYITVSSTTTMRQE
jgi:Flp pilus assembly protein TadG